MQGNFTILMECWLNLPSLILLSSVYLYLEREGKK